MPFVQKTSDKTGSHQPGAQKRDFHPGLLTTLATHWQPMPSLLRPDL